MPKAKRKVNNDMRHEAARQRRAKFLHLVKAGHSLASACREVNISDTAYRQWRSRHPLWAGEVDVARQEARGVDAQYDGTFQSFVFDYFGMRMSAFQVELAQAILDTPPGNILMVLLPPEHGKLLLPTEPIPTPAGWTTMGALQVGDEVLAPDGLPTAVTYVSPLQPTEGYRITFADGAQIVAGAEHLWDVVSRNDGYRTITVDTERIHHTTNANSRPIYSVAVPAALQLPAVDLPIDPYTLGAWLGDGHSAGGRITCPEDPEIIDRCSYPVQSVTRRDGREWTWSLRGLTRKLRLAGLQGNKHIPGVYLRAGTMQRLALLRGLMDTDGSCSMSGQCEFTTTSKQLAADVEELIWTLGHRVRRYEGRATLQGRDCGPKYRLSFYPDELVFTLRRKASRQNLQRRQGDRMRRRAIVACERLGPIEGICIAVDHPSHLYLAGPSFITTHNTTTYENWACWKLSEHPDWRGTVASENITISRKIVERTRNRLSDFGPYPKMVAKFGPFEPQKGEGRSQTWAKDRFNVYKKSSHDERDYNMIALGYGSSIVSTRTDHLHIDDVQSTKTQNETDKIEEWFRQDALSRPGETGITTIMGTRVCEDDFYERLAEDTDLEGILRVIKLPAIVHPYGEEPRPLWPERYTLEQLDRQRRKVGQEAWDRNYMQNPGASTRGRGTFSAEIVDRCMNPLISLSHAPAARSIVYVGLDPALGSNNCVIACEATPEGQLIVRDIREDTGFQRNEQIMGALREVVANMEMHGANVSDVVIEAMNFQKGLAKDERLLDMRDEFGFQIREHLTGVNKYDEDIGVPSMVTSFIREEIVLPWADDPETRHEIGELRRQLLAWKPKARGNKLRQDRVMALWFVWILWRSRFKQVKHLARADTSAWRTSGVPFQTAPSGLVLPVGVKV